MQRTKTKQYQTLAGLSQKCNKLGADETKELHLQMRLSSQDKFITFGLKAITQHLQSTEEKANVMLVIREKLN